MNLEEWRIVCNNLISQKGAGVNIVPEQWELMLHVAQLKHYKRKLGLPEEYRPGQPMPTQAFEITKRISDDLSPFMVEIGRNGQLPLPVSAQGEATLPADFFYPTGILYNLITPKGIKPKNVPLLTDKEWNETMSSQIIKKTKQYPIANIKNGYIRFAPLNLQFVDFTYLREPVRPVYAFTNTGGLMQYDNANSVQLEWDELNQLDIMYMLLGDLGVVVSKKEIVDYGEKVKERGI